jgi:hypothetical protein
MPTALVEVARFNPLSLLVSSTAASGTTAPETSVTVPATLPRLVCDRAGKARLAIASRLIASLIRNLLLNFLSSRHDIRGESLTWRLANSKLSKSQPLQNGTGSITVPIP